MREVLTYSRRGSRFTPRQQRGVGRARTPTGSSPTRPSTRPGFRLADWFGREAPAGRRDRLRRGRGDRRAGRARPDVQRARARGLAPGRRRQPGPGRRRPGPSNVRLCSVDAVWSLEHLVRPGERRRALDLLPRPVAQDPAPQAPARGRRFRGAGRPRLAPGAEWRLATDWADYAEQMRRGPRRRAAARGRSRAERWDERPVDQVRAQGRRGRARHHRPRLPPRLSRTPRPGRSTRARFGEAHTFCQYCPVAPAGCRGAAHIDF